MLIHNIQKGEFSFLKCELFLNRKRFLHKTLCTLIYKITYVFRHIAWFSLRFLMFREISVYMLLFCIRPFTVHQTIEKVLTHPGTKITFETVPGTNQY